MSLYLEDDTILVKLKLDIENIPNNEAVMTELHNLLIQYCDPYVPMREGVLSQNVIATKDYAHYQSPYAHYMHEGVVYGPSIPIIENGVIVGWWSPPNKYPTGDSITYSPEKHPLATHHWEQAMMKDKGKAFTQDIKSILVDNLNGGNK